jgi:3',5'-cyclic AMP phosphodiesterase CpdA
MIFAQITDFHLICDGQLLRDVLDSAATLKAAVQHLNGLDPRPDLVFATGDLVNHPDENTYQALREQLGEIEMPVYALPGNHDDRDMMRSTFGDLGYLPRDGEFLHYTIEDHRLRFIALDTVVPGSVGGEMCAHRLAWLEDRLAEEPARPTVIVMHHPPFVSGLSFMDRYAFAGGEAMEAVVRRYPSVERVIAGHMHRDITTRWGGTIASTSASLVFQMSLDLNQDAASSFVLEPPVCSLFRWTEDLGLTGYTSPIGDFEPRRTFDSQQPEPN